VRGKRSSLSRVRLKLEMNVFCDVMLEESLFNGGKALGWGFLCIVKKHWGCITIVGIHGLEESGV
jgi:hypothetical protein